MGFDDYLTKPVERDELLQTVERLLGRSEFADLEQEMYALVSKQAALRSTKPEEELAESEEFAELEERIANLRSDIDAALPGVESDEFVAMVRDIEADGDVGSREQGQSQATEEGKGMGVGKDDDGGE
jgi:DNA-binding response OmpR family regulator